MPTCRTRRSMSPMETSPSTSARRSSPATTSPPRSPPRSAATSTSRKAGEKGFDEIIVRVGPGKGRKVRFIGVLLGEWLNTSSSRVETFRVYRGRTGKFVLHVERSPDFTMVDAEGKPAGWRGYLGIGERQLRDSARRVDPRGRRDARGAPRADPAAALRHGRRLGPAAGGRGPRHLTSASRRARPGRCGMTAIERPRRRSARPGCASRTASRSSSTASTSRSPKARSSRCSGRTAPARRRRSTSCRRCIAADGGEVAGRRPRRRARARRGPGRHRRHRPVLGGRRAVHRRGEPPADGGPAPPRQGRGPPARRRSCSSGSTSSTRRRSRSRPTRAACGGGSTWR